MSLLSASPPLRDLNRRQVRWIGAAYVLTFASLPGQTIFIAQFNPSLRGEFGLSHGAFALIYTIATLASSICLVWAGALTDRVAPRRLAIFSLAGLGTMALAMWQVPHVVVLVLILFGLRLFGQGMMSQIAMTTMSRWFNRYRGRALALAQLGFSTGESTLPIIVTLAIGAFGWRMAWLGTSLAIIAILIPLVAFLLNDPPDSKRARAAGEVNPDAEDTSRTRGKAWTRGAVLRDPLFYVAIPGFMGPPAIGTLFIFHQAHLSVTKGWDPALFAGFFPLFSLTSVLFAILSGVLVDRFGAWRLVPFILVPIGFACLVIGLFDPIWVIPLFLSLFGMTTGMASPVVGALWAELYGTAHIGAVRALATAFFVFASAIGPGIAGVLIDAGFELTPQAFYYAAFCWAAALGYWMLSGRFRTRVELIRDEV